MENFDLDLRSIQEARNLARQGEEAAKKMATYTSEQIDKILKSMVEAAEEHAPVWEEWQWKRPAWVLWKTRSSKTTMRPSIFTMHIRIPRQLA